MTPTVSYPAPAPSVVQKPVDEYQTLSSSSSSFKPVNSGSNYQSDQSYGTRISTSQGHYKPQTLDSSNYPTRTVVSSQSSPGYQSSQGSYIKDAKQPDYLNGASYPPQRDAKYVGVQSNVQSNVQSVSPSVSRPVYQDQRAKGPAPSTSSDGRQYYQGQDGIYEVANTGHVQQQELFDSKEPCICVPFYLCKDEYLSNSARESDGPAVDIDERSARKSNVTRRCFPANDTEIPAYARDVMSRFVGGSNSCGLLRRCCKVPPSGGFENLPNGFQGGVPQGFPQGFPQDGFRQHQGSDVQSDFQQEYVPVQEHNQNQQHGGPLPNHIVGIQSGGHPPHRPGQGIPINNFPHRQPQHIQHVDQFQGSYNQHHQQNQHQQSINRPVYEPATSI